MTDEREELTLEALNDPKQSVWELVDRPYPARLFADPAPEIIAGDLLGRARLAQSQAHRSANQSQANNGYPLKHTKTPFTQMWSYRVA